MTLDEYIEYEKNNIDKFKQTWLEGQKKNPDQYPAEMEAGEWDEQLRAFQTL